MAEAGVRMEKAGYRIQESEVRIQKRNNLMVKVSIVHFSSDY